MAKKLYVGNLVWAATEDQLRELFEEHGSVDDVQILTERDTGRSRGFGFVTMPNDDEADRAIENLDGTDFQGRPLKVNVARPPEERGGGGGGGGGRRGGYGGGGGGYGGGGGRRGQY